ncbi:uncharacterized protein Bfra_000232 [Botrytis fragariae]|uniref:Uncharacterized protein n=1 Tax=Botrytis fragariae TaxID=1964551 RepID=A0A8H6B2P6_9HELO|nr:uncharacterized protein Bfra_000232 [Botrytis fragariae]KAF5878065.1 hypothetical protein Bfra_000232 [Botrytis fragariae]
MDENRCKYVRNTGSGEEKLWALDCEISALCIMLEGAFTVDDAVPSIQPIDIASPSEPDFVHYTTVEL